MKRRNGQIVAIPLEGVEWHDSFMDCSHHLLEVLREGGDPVLDGLTGRAVLQFTLAADISAREGREVRQDLAD